MKNGPILLTSFQAWRSHQPSNASNDLIQALKAQNKLPADAIWLENVPVSFDLAPIRVLNAIYRWQPRLVICCGMAEKRALLSIEQRAKKGEHTLETSVNTHSLLQRTQLSEISYDAGNYVCNHLYYYILESINKYKISTTSLFIHVPILNAENKKIILKDFHNLLKNLQQQD